MNQIDKYEQECKIEGYPKLEPSTIALIKAAISQGIKYEIIDENISFIKLYNDKHTEYIVQATRTSKDLNIFSFISDNKEFVKQMLKKHKICVPDGIVLDKYMTKKKIKSLITNFENKKIVIKPNSTNCGTGITIFNKPAIKEEIEDAIKKAFKYDSKIIIEEFREGKEYRLLVINGKCVCVIHRRNASVVGDGKKTIKELIEDKNKEPWHYVSERFIIIDKSLKEILKKQKLTINSIPKKDERIFVRDNSNISTGGESVDYTDEIPEQFKKVAEKATKFFGAKICGVDMLINDFNKFEYSIVEINDNPGIGICQWPYEGKGQNIGLEILKLLKFI